MLGFIVEVVAWILCIYGLLSIINDIIDEVSYKKIKNNTKLILTVKDAEEGIENYIRQLNFSKNFYNNLVVIDLDSDDDTICILKELEKENINMKVLNKIEGEEYLKKEIAQNC